MTEKGNAVNRSREFRYYEASPSIMENILYGLYDTILGQVTIAANASAIVAVKFGNQIPNGIKEQRTELTDRAYEELCEYLAGNRKYFDVPLAPQGTKFQIEVWNELYKIPYGETRSYKEIAEAIGKPKACRAVGMANNKNAIPLLIPCHRVIGANGSLVGYAGGIDMKVKLLQIEGIQIKQ